MDSDAALRIIEAFSAQIWPDYMAFICTVQEEVIDTEYRQRGQSFSITAHVGYDDLHNVNYWLHLGLDILPGSQMEFYFNIQMTDADEEETIWDSSRIAEIIPQSCRQKIRNLLLISAGRLVQTAKPAQFALATRNAHLPEKALEKYYQLCEIFGDVGYEVVRFDPYHGRHAWLMTQAWGDSH